jgi:hypothetical protein
MYVLGMRDSGCGSGSRYRTPQYYMPDVLKVTEAIKEVMNY